MCYRTAASMSHIGNAASTDLRSQVVGKAVANERNGDFHSRDNAELTASFSCLRRWSLDNLNKPLCFKTVSLQNRAGSDGEPSSEETVFKQELTLTAKLGSFHSNDRLAPSKSSINSQTCLDESDISYKAKMQQRARLLEARLHGYQHVMANFQQLYLDCVDDDDVEVAAEVAKIIEDIRCRQEATLAILTETQAALDKDARNEKNATHSSGFRKVLMYFCGKLVFPIPSRDRSAASTV